MNTCDSPSVVLDLKSAGAVARSGSIFFAEEGVRCDAVGGFDVDNIASLDGDRVVLVHQEKPECTGHLVRHHIYLLVVIVRVEVHTLSDAVDARIQLVCLSPSCTSPYTFRGMSSPSKKRSQDVS